MRRTLIAPLLTLVAFVAPRPADVLSFDEADDELMRHKRDVLSASELREKRISDFEYRAKIGMSGRSVPPGINRNTGGPHEHSREIARRLRQQSARG